MRMSTKCEETGNIIEIVQRITSSLAAFLDVPRTYIVNYV